ncbi:hypothetical protein [Kitasatospora sp. NPDC098663]|uniref:hypothetical protein n=1 Tax=Kitasatospora sp. NPDC098663 TaxID=3364096 RepID=UPI00380E396E
MTQTPAAPTGIGTALVPQRLSAERLSELPGQDEGTSTPLGRVTREIHTTASLLDNIQERLVGRARTIRADMQLVIAGRDPLAQATGGLGPDSQALHALAVRGNELHGQLEVLTDLHQLLAAAPDPAPPPPTNTPVQTVTAELRVNDTQLRALDAVARGKVFVSEYSIQQGRKIQADVQVRPATLQFLIDKRLAVQDTSTSLYVGQKVRITSLGARVHAAHARTTAAHQPAVAAEHASAAAGTGPAPAHGEDAMNRGPTTGPAPARLVTGAPDFAGRLAVVERLGMDTEDLLTLHEEPRELRTLAALISRQAARADELDQDLRQSAVYAIERLDRIRSGQHHEVQRYRVLRMLGTDLEASGARFDLATEHLGQAVFVYRKAAERLAQAPEVGRAVAARSRASAATPPTTLVVGAAPAQSAPESPRAPHR